MVNYWNAYYRFHLALALFCVLKSNLNKSYMLMADLLAHSISGGYIKQQSCH